MGGLIGASPKFQWDGLARVSSARGFVRPGPCPALLALLIPLSLILAQCGQAPGAANLAANAQSSSDSFDQRFPKPQFRDRFPTANESFQQRQASDFGRSAQDETGA